ncbi:MAG TPA: hypothetical protein VLG50_06955 [Candidatus Saccharimonadales bacterium]|nr:hypothetical protein [Candidatus Saccharimonadales bacterium]
MKTKNNILTIIIAIAVIAVIVVAVRQMNAIFVDTPIGSVGVGHHRYYGDRYYPENTLRVGDTVVEEDLY